LITFLFAWGRQGALLFCVDDLIIVSYIFDFEVVGVIKELRFFYFVIIGISGGIVKINLLVV
jgi:hypothetical protein